MKHLFKKALPLFLALFIIAGSIPLIAYGEEFYDVLTPDSETVIDFNTVESKTVTLSFTPNESGAYVIYSTGYEDSYCCVYLGDNEIAYSDDDNNSTNFRVVCHLEKDLSYSLVISLWTDDVSDNGLVTVKAVKVPETTVTCGEGMTLSVGASAPMQMIRLEAPKEWIYEITGQYDNSLLCAGLYHDSEGYITICEYLPDSQPISYYFSDVVSYYVLVFPIDDLENTTTFTLNTKEPPPATGMTLDHTTYTGVVGQDIVLTPIFTPENGAHEKVLWSVSDEEVASVDEQGCVSLLKAGEVTITATCGALSQKCVITVNAPPALSLCEQIYVYLDGGQSTVFSFTPEKSGTYCFFSFPDENRYVDPLAYLYDESFVETLGYGDDEINQLHFYIEAELTAGKTYALSLGIYNDEPVSFCLQVAHKPSTPFTSTAKDHSATCAHCGSFTERHHFDTNGICVFCGYEHGENHVFEYSEYDEDTHYASCVYCNVEAPEDHRFEGGDVCLDCGFGDTASGDLNGDLNGDGSITIADVALLLDVLAGKDEIENPGLADFNDTGSLTIADVAILLDVLAGKATI